MKTDSQFIRPLKGLQVSVTFQKTRFKAVCSVFPECKGFGKSEEEAVRKLCKSVSKFISATAYSLVETVIYEALAEPEARHEKRGVQTPASLPFSSSATLRYPQDHISKIPKERDIRTLIDRLHSPHPFDELLEQPEVEGFYLGFPLSLN